MFGDFLQHTNLLQDLLVVGFIVLSVSREIRWTPYSAGVDLRFPIIVGAIGAYSLITTTGDHLTTLDLALLALAVLIAAGTGLIGGKVTQFRPITDEALSRSMSRGTRSRRPSTPPSVESRTGWIGAVLWAVALADRYAIEAAAEHFHSALANNVGLGLCIVGASELVRRVVVKERLNRTAIRRP